ncbi:hypothetical protein EVC45_44965 [Paraburkholderia sp. UYCP14C]|uniref:hypothetical protein n=1 Tax=Paraburkholderia sp. UYCP14C TaxID=2511130 RepID=UPI00101FE153|nr:hypothetical protein [Paraburkholderia sp. UYCP14C]RZF23378.1 hypothetical protein EVC45_44965 [Paraburkholderia sp. UYCP14C]
MMGLVSKGVGLAATGSTITDGALIDKEMSALGTTTRMATLHTAQETARNALTGALAAMIKNMADTIKGAAPH